MSPTTRAALLAPLVLLATLTPTRAQDAPRQRLFTASELPRLAEGVTMAPGEVTIKVWAPARDVWTIQADGATATLSRREEGDNERPAWRDTGVLRVGEGEQVKLRIEGLPTGDPEDAKGQGSRPAVPPVIALTADASFDFGPALDVLRSRLDSAAPTEDARRTTVRTNQQGADFLAPETPDEWRRRAQTVREQMLVTLGLWPMPPRTPLNPRVFGKLDRDGYTIERVVLETLPGFYLGGNLYRPTGKEGRLPAVLCPHGHWEDGRVNPEVQQRCIRWAKLGCVVFMYDMVGYNDSKPFGHKFLNPRLDRWGYSLAGLQTWNSLRALDWLTARPDVDAVRIGCTGESGGGTQTFLLTALDDRIKVAAPVVMVSDTFQGGCVCENAAGLRHGTDNVEFAALCAPRPMKLVGATGDWTAKTMTNADPAIRGVYELVGRPEHLAAEVFGFPHNYNRTSRNAVYAFMAPRLLGPIDPAATTEGDQTPEKPEGLRAFTSDNPAPEGTKTPEQLENDLIRGLSEQVERLATADEPAPSRASRDFLLTSLRVRVGIENPPPAELEAEEVRRSERPGMSVIHHEVRRGGSGTTVAVVSLAPDRPSGRVTVVFGPHGKAGLVKADGQPVPLAAALLGRGHRVVGFDPMLVGEAADPAAFATRRPGTVHYETYNKTTAADRLQDLATVLAWARSLDEAREVNLVGHGRCGVLALLARPALEGLARTAIDLHDFDYGDGSDAPDDLHLPGVLQFGGPPAAAALTAPAPLWVHRAGSHFADWPRRAYGRAGSAEQLRIDEGRADDEALARWLDLGE